jgi:hypothetical protein
LRFIFYLGERNRGRDRPFRGDFNRRPIPFCCGWILESFFGNPRDANNRFAIDAVIEEHLIPEFHGAEVIARLEIAYAGPFRFSVADELLPGIGGRFLLNQPILRHLHFLPWHGSVITEILRDRGEERFRNFRFEVEFRETLGYRLGE